MSSQAVSCPNPPRRGDLAWRHAEASSFRSVRYVISLVRWSSPRDLSKRARRVLRWFIALHRSGPVGYLGTRGPLDALADAIAEATEEACSRSTLERGIRELVELGYLLKSYGYGHTGRQLGPDLYVRDRIVVLTLTERARALWGPMPTPDHKASDCQTYDRGSPSEAPSFEGSSARAIDVASPDRDVAYATSTEEPLRGTAGPRGRAAASTEPRTSPRPVAPLAELADCLEGDSQAVCQPPARLASRPTPRPSGSGPVSRRETVAAMLETLRAVCYGRGRLEALVIARAAFELTARLSPGEPGSGIDWDYWLARWPQLERAERRRFARAELVPLLVPVASPARSSSSPARASRSSSSRGAPGQSPGGGGSSCGRTFGGEPSTPPRPPTIHLSGEPSSPELELQIDPGNPYAAHFKRLFPGQK